MRTLVDLPTFGDLVTGLAAASLDGRHWETFVENLSRAVGFKTNVLGLSATGAGTGLAMGGYDPAMKRSYMDYYGDRNPWASAFLGMDVGAIVDARAVLPEEDLFRTEFYNDWIRPQGDISLAGGTAIENGPAGVFMLAGNLPRRMGDDRLNDWMALVGLLVPHLEASWWAARTASATRLNCGKAGGLIVLDDAGHIVFTDAVSEAFLAQGYPFKTIRRNRLGSVDPGLAGWLDAALRAVRQTAATPIPDGHAFGWDISGSRINPDRPGGPWPTPMAGLKGPGLCLRLRPLAARPGATSTLQDRYDLTHAEAAVARALTRGLTPTEIAGARAVSIHTVRSQIRSAMWKCGVSRQTQLVALVARAGAD